MKRNNRLMIGLIPASLLLALLACEKAARERVAAFPVAGSEEYTIQFSNL